MEIPYVPKATVAKSDESMRIKARDASRTPAENASGDTTGNDKLSLSAKARTLSKLRNAFENLPDNAVAVQDIKTKIAEHGAVTLSAEEIVASILHGTLFSTD